MMTSVLKTCCLNMCCLKIAIPRYHLTKRVADITCRIRLIRRRRRRRRRRRAVQICSSSSVVERPLDGSQVGHQMSHPLGWVVVVVGTLLRLSLPQGRCDCGMERLPCRPQIGPYKLTSLTDVQLYLYRGTSWQSGRLCRICGTFGPRWISEAWGNPVWRDQAGYSWRTSCPLGPWGALLPWELKVQIVWVGRRVVVVQDR